MPILTHTEEEGEVLSCCLNFNIETLPRPRDAVCAVERAVSELCSEVCEAACGRAIGVACSLQKHNARTHLPVAVEQDTWCLRNNSGIVIPLSDKSNATVLPDKGDCHKMLALIEDQQKLRLSSV